MAAAVRFSVTPWIAVVTVSLELVPAVPFYNNQSVIAFNNKVRGVIYDTSHETPHFETIWLEEG